MCSSLPNRVEWSVVWAAPLKLVVLFGSSWKSCCSCALAEPVCHWNSYQTLVPYRQCIFGTRRKQALKSGYICEKSGELFWTTTEIDITKRLKAMHTSSGTGRNKSQTSSGAWRACKKTSFFICMSTTILLGGMLTVLPEMAVTTVVQINGASLYHLLVLVHAVLNKS